MANIATRQVDAKSANADEKRLGPDRRGRAPGIAGEAWGAPFGELLASGETAYSDWNGLLQQIASMDR